MSNHTRSKGRLEEKLGKLYVNLSLHQTLDQLLRERSFPHVCRWLDLTVSPQGSEACRQAEVWIQAQWEKIFLAEGTSPIFCSLRWNIFKVKAFGESGQWTELNALAKTKKSPIGFAPFLDVCLKQVKSVVSLDLWYNFRVREHKLPSTSHCWVKRTD